MKLTKHRSPVIDGHVDLPIMVREAFGNDVRKVDLNKKTVGVNEMSSDYEKE